MDMSSFKDFWIDGGKACFAEVNVSNSYSYSLVASSQFNIKALLDISMDASVNSAFFAGANVSLSYAKKPECLKNFTIWSADHVGKWSKGNVPRSATVYNSINANTGIYHSGHSYSYKTVGGISIITKPEKVKTIYRNTAVVAANIAALLTSSSVLGWSYSLNDINYSKVVNAVAFGLSLIIANILAHAPKVASSQVQNTNGKPDETVNNPAVVIASEKSDISSSDSITIGNSANGNDIDEEKNFFMDPSGIVMKTKNNIEFAFGSGANDRSVIDVNNDEVSISFGDKSKILIMENNIKFSKGDTYFNVTNDDINFAVNGNTAMTINKNGLIVGKITTKDEKIIISP